MDDHMTKDPPEDDTKSWLQDDAQLYLQIKNSIDGKAFGLVNHCNYANELLEFFRKGASSSNV